MSKEDNAPENTTNFSIEHGVSTRRLEKYMENGQMIEKDIILNLHKLGTIYTGSDRWVYINLKKETLSRLKGEYVSYSAPNTPQIQYHRCLLEMYEKNTFIVNYILKYEL